MNRIKLILIPLLITTAFSMSGCAFFASSFVRSILIFVGKSIGDAIIVQVTEKLMDKYIFNATIMDEATDSVNKFYNQVKPFPDEMRKGQIPGKDSMSFEVNGERNGVTTKTTIKIAHTAIFFERESTATDNWRLSSYSEGMIRNRLNVAAAQISLKNRGFTLNETDGIAGPQTVRVLKAFQKARDLLETGELDQATKTLLLTQ